MIKPNWDTFKAKFNENPQNNFEWFCYLLFCKEFDIPYGIFRYKNQSAIETDPVVVGDETVGWQAKFYDNALSNHKAELLKAIVDAKKDYPNITTLHLYTNKEWGQYKGQKPKGLKEIEAKAKELSVNMEWRTSSFFESEFVCEKNEILAKHFFTLDKSIVSLLEELQNHTQNILFGIQTSIDFNGNNFEIDRSEQLEKLKNRSQQISIVSGVGGVGKTVIIKKLYEESVNKIPFFAFKATEFKLRNINDLFSDLTFYEFVNALQNDDNKIIVIDSAEKLLDLRNLDPFKEFLSLLIKSGWRVIFTTRDNYLEDLNCQFFEFYNIAPLNVGVATLKLEEINAISKEQEFSLPEDEKLLELIKNPFYLNEYLKFYDSSEELNYKEFKNKLWNKNIRKSKPERERCFLNIAYERANSGQFFITPNCDAGILDDELTRDGILGYETVGYFITHDIYEEWALEKIIESEYLKKSNNKEFFKNIGQSLPVRRSLRSWLSENLLLANDDIKKFIVEVIGSSEVAGFWKDEILVSVLLSDYSESFFNIFKSELLEENQLLLKRLTFILRIACKEVDGEFFMQLGISNLNLFTLEYVLTKPKGKGWEALIKFVFDNLEDIGIQNINFILPVINDWNTKIKIGSTSRYSSLIALKYYQWALSEDVYFSRGETKEHLLQTILYGSSEIKEELSSIFDEIIKNEWKNHRDPYHDLSEFLLTKIEGVNVASTHPNQLLKLAELFWTRTPPKESRYSDYSHGVEPYFGINENYSHYHPASAYQTPVYWLLKSALKETVDFILGFTNKSVEKFAKSEFAKYEAEEVDVFIDKETTIKQYICNRLWCAYRGTQVLPDVLESMHMALEKFFLEVGEFTDTKTLDNWLEYLLRNTVSASISAVVASIVLAYPDKTFNVASKLFRTKEFFLFDTTRLTLDASHKHQLLMLQNNFGSIAQNQMYENERIKACDDKHRKLSLENQFLNYQCFRNEGVNEQDSKDRQEALWKILDSYYSELPDETEQTESDKVWRLFLARMDRRKMDITTEEAEGGVAINFNPKLEPELKEYSEKSLEKSAEPMRYTSLKIWAEYKYSGDEKHKEYTQYEEEPKLALKEAKDIVATLKDEATKKNSETGINEEDTYSLFNRSIPAYVCSVLLRDYIDLLSKSEKQFCKDIVLEFSMLQFSPNYQYQISDGTQPAISILSKLFVHFPEDKGNIKTILLLTLFNTSPAGGMLSTGRYNMFSMLALHDMWDKYPTDAHSLLLGYLYLSQVYDDLIDRVRQENYKNGTFGFKFDQLINKLLEENDDVFQSVIDNKIVLSKIGELSKLDLSNLRTAFQIIPTKTDNEEHKNIAKQIIAIFADKLLNNNRDDKVDYTIRHEFLSKYAYFILSLNESEIENYLQPFLHNFNSSESIAELLQEFVSAEDKVEEYEKFWVVWNILKEKIEDICKGGDGYWHTDSIVESYLFARVQWKDTAKDWHTFKSNDAKFFNDISKSIGHCPSALYSIAKLLDNVGNAYIDDGVVWLSQILENNNNYVDKKLVENTVFYLEKFARIYTFKNKETIKKKKEIKDKMIVILNYLIEKGSAVGYMLRENIV
ncbi:MAG: ATP-binding protein [Gammaproteobacteria bacterium]|nr:ATP-binding protein [Gammaproteobacteria bacterium]